MMLEGPELFKILETELAEKQSADVVERGGERGEVSCLDLVLTQHNRFDVFYVLEAQRLFLTLYLFVFLAYRIYF